MLYLLFDGLISLYVISALFGLFQGGIVPSYAIIVREYFPPREAGTRVGIVMMATLCRHGARRLDVRHDLRSHRLVSGGVHERLAWNLVNVSIATWLLFRTRSGMRFKAA